MTITKGCGCEVDPRDGCVYRHCRAHDPERKPWYVWWLWAVVIGFTVLTLDGFLRGRDARLETTWACPERLREWQHRVELVRVDGATLHECAEAPR